MNSQDSWGNSPEKLLHRPRAAHWDVMADPKAGNHRPSCRQARPGQARQGELFEVAKARRLSCKVNIFTHGVVQRAWFLAALEFPWISYLLLEPDHTLRAYLYTSPRFQGEHCSPGWSSLLPPCLILSACSPPTAHRCPPQWYITEL